MKYLHFQDMPKSIQDLVDGAEFLRGVRRKRIKGKLLYFFDFEDSFEVWCRVYDDKGSLVQESIALEKERY